MRFGEDGLVDEAGLRFPALARVAGLVHAVTTRHGGVSTDPFASLNLGRSTPDDPQAVAANRRRVADALGFAEIRTLSQVHGARVVGVEELADAPPSADAVVVARPGTLAGVLGADCALLLAVDPAKRALALVHAGWRGVVAGVVAAAVGRLVERHGAAASRLCVGLGPAICGRCYEVGPEVAEAVGKAVPDPGGCLWSGRGDRHHLDLHAALRQQLSALGIPGANVEAIDVCTREATGTFYSHRRDGPRAGRHALVAAWV